MRGGSIKSLVVSAATVAREWSIVFHVELDSEMPTLVFQEGVMQRKCVFAFVDSCDYQMTPGKLKRLLAPLLLQQRQ